MRETIRIIQPKKKDFLTRYRASCVRSDGSDEREHFFMAKQMTLTVETDSLLIIRGTARSGWCQRCATGVEILALQDFGSISDLERQALEGWLRTGGVHQVDSEDGSTLICLNSMFVRVRNTK
jgi:hypothetical protein